MADSVLRANDGPGMLSPPPGPCWTHFRIWLEQGLDMRWPITPNPLPNSRLIAGLPALFGGVENGGRLGRKVRFELWPGCHTGIGVFVSTSVLSLLFLKISDRPFFLLNLHCNHVCRAHPCPPWTKNTLTMIPSWLRWATRLN